jgi:hypothetical protein
VLSRRSGGNDSRFILDKTSPARLTYLATDSTPTTASLMAEGIKDCLGTCQAGVCTITPRKAFCCSTAKTNADASATVSSAKRRNRKHGSGTYGEKPSPSFHCWN